jgi:undecaprenyl pyrophosphate phosphatase UppP
MFLQIIVAFVIAVLVGLLVNRFVPSQNTRVIVNTALMLIIVGMGLWAINSYIPMAGPIRAILNILVVAAVCVRVLQVLGLWGGVVRMWRNLTRHREPTDVPR